MNSCDIRFPGYDARSARSWIRWELFLDMDVRDVLVTPRADTLQIIHRYDPDPVAWIKMLKAAGFPEPLIGEPVGVAQPGPVAA